MDRLNLTAGNRTFEVDMNDVLDISIPLKSGELNPNCYSSPSPAFNPILSKNFIGSVSKGGACNHYSISLSPHGNGTHTECYGHIAPEGTITINKCLTRFHFISQLITVKPFQLVNGDQVVRWADLRSVLAKPTSEALIIRTLPNNAEKLHKHYSGTNPPYLERKAAKELALLGVSHLLVDLPSIDKEQDSGELAAHHDFWRYPENPRQQATITELIYVPNAIPDGQYLLNLQIVSLESDASPSKPVLFTARARNAD